MQHDPTTAMDATLDALAAEIRPGGLDRLRQLFEDQGCKAPSVIWSPKPDDCMNPLVVCFAETCMEFRQPDGRILMRDFDLNCFAALQDWMLLLEVEKDGTVFRYSHYGNSIAEVRGISMLGRTTEDFGGHIGQFFAAVYRAVMI